MFVSACIIILAILILIFIILCKLYITLFMITGLSRSVARFQIFSLFTNSGFTSGESELIMYNKLRRKIATATMITGYIFGTLVTALVVGVVAGLNFRDSEYSTIYWERILIVFGVTVGILIVFLILTKVPALRKITYNILKKLVAPDTIGRKGNPIIYNEMVYDKYIAQVEIIELREIFKGNPIGKLNFQGAGVTILLVTTKDDKVVSGMDLDKHTLQVGDIVQVFGGAKEIDRIFSMRE